MPNKILHNGIFDTFNNIVNEVLKHEKDIGDNTEEGGVVTVMAGYQVSVAAQRMADEAASKSRVSGALIFR